MKTRLFLGFLVLLSSLLIVACPQVTEPPPVTGTPAPTDTGGKAGVASEAPFNKEIFVLVSTEGDRFSVKPEDLYVRSPEQLVTWFAEDPQAQIEIIFEDASRNPDPSLKPPGRPCETPARRCGEKGIQAQRGTYKYIVRGSVAGRALPDYDPQVIILY